MPSGKGLIRSMKKHSFQIFEGVDFIPKHRLVADEPLFGIIYTISVFTWRSAAEECRVMAELRSRFIALILSVLGNFSRSCTSPAKHIG